MRKEAGKPPFAMMVTNYAHHNKAKHYFPTTENKNLSGLLSPNPLKEKVMFKKPNYTQTPNEFFDEIAKTLSEGELRVLLVIMRQTFGWGNKKWDRISLSQFVQKTGMEHKSVCRSIKSLVEKKIAVKHKRTVKGKEESWYSLSVESPEECEMSIEDSNNFTQCPKDTPPSVLKTHTKETITKEKEKPPTPLKPKSEEGGGLSKILLRRSIPRITDIEFELAWNEYQKAPPRSVKNPKAWLKAVVERIRFENKNAMDAHKRAESHKRQAEYNEELVGNGSIVACSKHVEFVRGSNVKIATYDTTDEEWTQKTGWIPYDYE